MKLEEVNRKRKEAEGNGEIKKVNRDTIRKRLREILERAYNIKYSIYETKTIEHVFVQTVISLAIIVLDRACV